MRHINARWIFGLTAVAILLLVGAPAQAGHSSRGCSNCHVPHLATPQDTDGKYGVPLWSPLKATGTLSDAFTVYSSPTFDALGTGITHPDGPSKLCLGCHDGTYPTVATKGIHVFGDGKAMTLTESHPISFKYDTALTVNPKLKVPGSLKDPSTALSGLTPAGTIATDVLDKYGKMQCTSCHDVHASGVASSADMLRWDYDADNGKTFCRKCHNK